MRHACLSFAALPLAALVASCAAIGPPALVAQPRATIERVFETYNHCNIEDLVSNFADGNLLLQRKQPGQASMKRQHDVCIYRHPSAGHSPLCNIGCQHPTRITLRRRA